MLVLGIDVQIINWTKSFLENRIFNVKVNTSMSMSTRITSGIPQGTVLGPLLYNIYAFDIAKYTTNKVVSFADDTKLYKSISKHGAARELDILSLQNDVNGISKWAIENKMSINTSKCVHLSIGRSSSTYTLNGTSIANVNQFKDLGVLISSDLSSKNHITAVCQKARQIIGMFCKAFAGKLTDGAFCILYKSHIRSLLEYCPALWSPKYKNEIDELESVQRFALKLLLPQKWNQSISMKLADLNLTTLESRRYTADLIECFKFLTSTYDVNIPAQLIMSTTSTRGHNRKLFKPRSTSTNVTNSFFHRVVEPWNSLPADIVESESVSIFRNRVKNYVNTLPQYLF